MISQELLGRARGVLAGIKDNGPGAGVLRELVDAIEAAYQPGDVWLSVPPSRLPALVYLSGEYVATLTDQGTDLRRQPPNDRLQLHIMRALLDYSTARVVDALDADQERGRVSPVPD